MKGGKRIGAGRKKGSLAPHTLEANAAKKRITETVSSNIDSLISPQIRKAKKGDTFAFKELMDRAYGKAHQSISGDEGGPIELKITWGAQKQ